VGGAGVASGLPKSFLSLLPPPVILPPHFFRSLSFHPLQQQQQQQNCPPGKPTDRPIYQQAAGLSEATLRIRETESDYRSHLRRCFLTLFDVHAGTSAVIFDVTVTANAVLRGRANGRYSMFYGQDYGRRGDFTIGGAAREVHSLADVDSLPIDFDISDFEDVFFSNFDNSDVSVHSLVNIVYIVRRYLVNFEADQRVGQRLVKLY
jgi:hypothetical protein